MTGLILIVDDETTVSRFIRSVLEKQGLTVVVHSSGPEALEYAKSMAGQISLALIDMIMPGMSGAELQRKLQEIQPNLPVIRMSGHSERILKSDLGKTYLAKPFTIKELLQIVNDQMLILPDSTSGPGSASD